MEIDILNRIKWDNNITEKDKCLVYYLDRVQNKLVIIKYDDIWEWDKFSMRVYDIELNEDKDIPLHRIRKIEDSKGNILFNRMLS
jgi:uncharacterized protein (UPF0248 family)